MGFEANQEIGAIRGSLSSPDSLIKRGTVDAFSYTTL